MVSAAQATARLVYRGKTVASGLGRPAPRRLAPCAEFEAKSLDEVRDAAGAPLLLQPLEQLRVLRADALQRDRPRRKLVAAVRG